jgi:hypothetical protein
VVQRDGALLLNSRELVFLESSLGDVLGCRKAGSESWRLVAETVGDQLYRKKGWTGTMAVLGRAPLRHRSYELVFFVPKEKQACRLSCASRDKDAWCYGLRVVWEWLGLQGMRFRFRRGHVAMMWYLNRSATFTPGDKSQTSVIVAICRFLMSTNGSRTEVLTPLTDRVLPTLFSVSPSAR